MATKTVFITDTGLTTWQVPSDFDSLVGIDCIGAGASAGWPGNGNGNVVGGAGGGAWARITSLSGLASGFTAHISVGLGGAAKSGVSSAEGSDGGNTWFSTTTVAPTSTSEGVLAEGGKHGQCLPA